MKLVSASSDTDPSFREGSDVKPFEAGYVISSNNQISAGTPFIATYNGSDSGKVVFVFPTRKMWCPYPASYKVRLLAVGEGITFRRTE